MNENTNENINTTASNETAAGAVNAAEPNAATTPAAPAAPAKGWSTTTKVVVGVLAVGALAGAGYLIYKHLAGSDLAVETAESTAETAGEIAEFCGLI